MSKKTDMLGRIVAALVGIPVGHLGLLLDVVNRLGSEDCALWKERFAEVLREGAKNMKVFPIWKTITIGGESKETLLAEVVKSGQGGVDGYVHYLMTQSAFTTMREQRMLKLTRCAVGDLGFTERTTTLKIIARIKEVGSLCPAEVGPHLWRQFAGQPKDDTVSVITDMMEPSSQGEYQHCTFYVWRCDDGRVFLKGTSASSGQFWELDDELVFVARD